jgi:hypothetical protein
MKNRSWLCYALDLSGLVALIGAGLALFSALWFASSMAEPLLLSVFKYCLMSAVGTFLVARMWEISQIFKASPVAPQKDVVAPANNVETLPQRRSLPRAA